MPLGVDEDGYDIRSPWSETKAANTASQVDNYLNINFGTTVNVTKDWKFDFDYTYASETGVIKKPGTRYTAADSWFGRTLKTDANGNQIYVNNEGQQVDASASGAMPAYKFANTEYTSHGANPDHIYRKSSGARRHTFNATTDYNWQLNDDNNFKFLVGMNLVTYDYEDNWSQITDLTDISNPQFDLAIGTQTTSGNQKWEGQMGYFGRINYNYKEKYLLEANLRYDGTSKFPSGMQWRWFPSFSAGWRISEEEFMKDIDWLSNLKLRASWGKLGNNSIGNYEWQALYGSGYNYAFNSNKSNGLAMTTFSNYALEWEETAITNIGLDFGVLNNRLNGTIEVYDKKTDGILYRPTLPESLNQFTSPLQNLAGVNNKGLEITLGWNDRVGDISYSVSGNFTYNKNKVTKYKGELVREQTVRPT